jgi:hypothetical protein
MALPSQGRGPMKVLPRQELSSSSPIRVLFYDHTKARNRHKRWRCS